jgi:hypothetical protein
MSVTAFGIEQGARDVQSGWDGNAVTRAIARPVLMFNTGLGIPWIIDLVSFGIAQSARDRLSGWDDNAVERITISPVSWLSAGLGIPWVINLVSFDIKQGLRDVRSQWNDTTGRAPQTNAYPASLFDVGYGISLGRITGRVTCGRDDVPVRAEVFALADGTLQVEGMAVSDAETGEFVIESVTQGRSYTLLYRHPANDTNDMVLRDVVAGPPS